MLHCYHTELTVILINSDTGNERDLTLILSSFSFSLSFMFLFLFLLIIHVYLHSNSHDRISVKESKTRYLRFISHFFLSLSPFLFNLCTKYIHNKQRRKEEHVKSTNIICVHSNVCIKSYYSAYPPTRVSIPFFWIYSYPIFFSHIQVYMLPSSSHNTVMYI